MQNMQNHNENVAVTTGTIASSMSFLAIINEYSDYIYLFIVFLSFCVSVIFHILGYRQKERQIRLLEEKVKQQKPVAELAEIRQT